MVLPLLWLFATNPSKVPLFRFPNDLEEQERWPKGLPSKVKDTSHIGLCESTVVAIARDGVFPSDNF